MSSDLVTGDLRSPLKRCSRPPFQTQFSFHTARMGLLGVPGLSLLLLFPMEGAFANAHTGCFPSHPLTNFFPWEKYIRTFISKAGLGETLPCC